MKFNVSYGSAESGGDMVMVYYSLAKVVMSEPTTTSLIKPRHKTWANCFQKRAKPIQR